MTKGILLSLEEEGDRACGSGPRDGFRRRRRRQCLLRLAPAPEEPEPVLDRPLPPERRPRVDRPCRFGQQKACDAGSPVDPMRRPATRNGSAIVSWLPAARIAIMRKSENSSCVKCHSVVPVFVLSADTRAFPMTISAPRPVMIEVAATTNATYRRNAKSPKWSVAESGVPRLTCCDSSLSGEP